MAFLSAPTTGKDLLAALALQIEEIEGVRVVSTLTPYGFLATLANGQAFEINVLRYPAGDRDTAPLYPEDTPDASPSSDEPDLSDPSDPFVPESDYTPPLQRPAPASSLLPLES